MLPSPKAEQKLHGGKVNYYLAPVERPRRASQEPYTPECEDIIASLNLTFDEACIFKEIWRTANARLNNGKVGHTPLYGRQKIYHYACEMLLDSLFGENPNDKEAYHESVRGVPDISSLAGAR